MLEHPSLLLRPGSPGPGETRTLVDPATGRLVGVARWQLPARRLWFPWFSGPVLTVHEADDEPLVFTVRRRGVLRPRWEVGDADGHRVALVWPGWVLDRFGDCLAWVDHAPNGGARFHGRDGREVAWLDWSGEDLRLTFAPELQGEPFIKMALLAAALTGAADA